MITHNSDHIYKINEGGNLRYGTCRNKFQEK